MFGKPRSGIPVSGKSSIPVKRTAGQQPANTARPTQANGSSSIPKPSGKMSASDLPKDPKLLTEMVFNLQKQVREKDDALMEMSDKLSLKAEECDSLMEERDIVRSKSSVDLQQVTEDHATLQETLRRKDRYIQEMESSHNEEKRQLKAELEEQSSENEIELEMLRKEMEDLKLREERWKRVADLNKKDSDYDSSDVGSRDQSPEVEALKEQLASLQGHYEDEITVLKEKLETQMEKFKEASDKLEEQEFKFQEKLSELKSTFDKERNVMSAEHRAEMETMKHSYEEKLKGLDTGSQSPGGVESVNSSEREEYENQISKLEDEAKNLEKQLEERQAQVTEDMLIMKNEFETQLDDAKNVFESEKEQFEKTVSELRSQTDDMSVKHASDIERMEEAFRKEKEEMQKALQTDYVLSEQRTKESELQKKILEYENEVEQLKGNLQKERNEFVEARELLDGMITDQENDFAVKEKKIRSELNEQHRKEMERVILESEQRSHQTVNSHLQDGDKGVDSVDDNTQGFGSQEEKLRLEIEALKNQHEKELERLHDNLETLQTENEDLKTEFDLVVADLSSELESTKKKGTPVVKRRNSLVLKEQIETMRGHQEEEMRLLSEKVEAYEENIAELEAEVERLRVEGGGEEDDDLKTKVAELEYEIGTLKEEKEEDNAALEKYKAKVLDLQSRLENSEGEKSHVQISQDEHKKEVDSLKQENVKIVAELEDYRATVELLRREAEEIRVEKETVESVVASYEMQIHNLNDELEKIQARHDKEQEDERQTIANLQADKELLKSTLDKKSQDNKIRVEKLTGELDRIEEENKRVVASHKQMSEEVISKLHEKIEDLQEEGEKLGEENELLKKEMGEIRRGTTEGGDEMKGDLLVYQEQVKKFSEKIQSLESLRQQSEEEKQELQDEIENLRYSREVDEPVITLASVDENFAANPASLNLEYEQQMKGLAGDYEIKIQKLETELEEERNKTASKTRRIESIGLEIETLRENLEQERLSTSNSQTRLVNFQERHEEEIKTLKKQLEMNAKDHEDKAADNEETVKVQFAKTIKTLEADLETALQANSEQADQLADLRTQLEKAVQIKTAQQEDIAKLNRELEEFQQQQIAHEANFTAEQLIASQEHGKTVDSVKADLGAARQLNKRQEEEIKELKHDLEEFEQQQIAHEANLTAEQLKIHETEKTQRQDLKRKTREITSLKSELETALQTNREQSQEMTRLKNEYRELQKTQTTFEERVRGEYAYETKGNAQKIEALEEEIRRKTEEMTKLFSVLDTEQKGRERVLLETEKHLTYMHQAEQEKVSAERVITELQNENQNLKGEITKGKELYDSYVTQSEKAQLEEHEEVEKLNRSLTETQMDKGKLAAGMETLKDELDKTQEKYYKLKEKFIALRQKRKEEKEKYDEVLLTPRFEMGLQTSLLEPEELDQTKEQLSCSMREQGRLEDEVENLQRDTHRTKTEIQALRRANEVLRRQNQVLYLETESLRKAGYGVDVDVPRLQQQAEQLVQDKENLEIENRYLKEALVEREKQEEESREKDDMNDSDRRSAEFELQDIQEKHAKTERENSKLIEENDFLLKQGRRLQSQVDQLESDIQGLKQQTPMTSTPMGIQSQAFISEIIQRDPGKQLMLESSPVSFGEEGARKNPNEVQLFVEEHQRLKEQLVVLQRHLKSKEDELHQTNSSRREMVDGLVNERQALLTQIESMNEALERHGEKNFEGTNSQKLNGWDAKRRADFTNASPFTKTAQIPSPGFPLSNVQELEFNVDNYLGSAYWEASKFLERVQQVN